MAFKKGQHPWNYKTKGLYKKSPEALLKLKENAKNNPNYGMKNKHHSEDTREKQSKIKIGKKQNEETRKKRSEKLKGRITSPNTLFIEGNKVNLHRIPSQDTRNKRSISMKKAHAEGRHSGAFKEGDRRNLNKVRTPEMKEKNRIAHLGEKSFFWNGGISYAPYTVDWCETLKRSIRERDHYTCKICNRLQESEAFNIHHINYIKEDCNPNNLITLCNSCHSKTNVNRNNWINFFKFKKFFNNYNN